MTNNYNNQAVFYHPITSNSLQFISAAA